MNEGEDVARRDAVPAEADLDALESALGYCFNDREILRRALTHASSTAEAGRDNERLEFFGDAVLDFVVCEHLFHEFPSRGEGELTEVKSELVRRRTLARAAKSLNVRDFLVLGRGISGREKLPASVYANVFEALVAAIYLDGGYGPVQAFILECLHEDLHACFDKPLLTNFKSFLQQQLQRSAGAPPEYRVISEQGPDHAKIFEVAVYAASAELGRGQGVSKKEAQQMAAKAALEHLTPSDSAAESASADPGPSDGQS